MNIEATIIVMVYKNLDQVRQTLDSIKKQTYSNYEVIVSDDGSPNYTQEDFDKITEQYKNEFTYFKLINNGINRGTVKHFNSLIKQAKGTIICPLSSGDQFYNENSLQEIMNAFDQEDKLIYTSKRMIKKENSIEYYPSLYQVSLLDQSNHFFEYIIDMSFNRTLRNKQGLCDFRIAASLVNQFNKLFFPVCQIILLFDFLESVLKAKLRSLVAIAEICRNKGASVDKIYHNNIYDKPEYDSQIQRFSDEPAVSPVYGSLAPEV